MANAATDYRPVRLQYDFATKIVYFSGKYYIFLVEKELLSTPSKFKRSL